MRAARVTVVVPCVCVCVCVSGADTGGVLWVLKNLPSGKIHYKLSRGGFRGGALGLSPNFIISVHARFSVSDSFVDLPQEVVN